MNSLTIPFRRFSYFFIILGSFFFQSCGDSCVNVLDESLSYYYTDLDDLSETKYNDFEIVEIDGKPFTSTSDVLSKIHEITGHFEQPHYGINQFHKNFEYPVFQLILRKDGELYTGCVSSNRGDRTICNFENGLPTLFEQYETHSMTGDEHLVKKIEFKNGVPHGYWFEKNLVGDEGEPMIFREGNHNNGLVDGTWKEFYLQEGSSKKSVLRKVWKFNKGDRISFIQNTYTGSIDNNKDYSTERTYYKNQLLSETKFEGDGKFRYTTIVRYDENQNYLYPNKTGQLGSIDEGKRQIDKFLQNNKFPE